MSSDIQNMLHNHKSLGEKKALERFNISLLYTFYSSHHNQFLCLSMISYFAVTHFFEAVFLLGGSTPNSLVVIVSNIIYISSSTEFSHFCPFPYSNNDQPCEWPSSSRSCWMICTGIAIVHWKMQQLLPRGFHFTLNLLNFAFHMQLIVKLLCMYIWRNRKIGQSHSILKSLEDILLYIYFQFVYFNAKANVVLYRWYYYYLPQYLHHEVVQRRP